MVGQASSTAHSQASNKKHKTSTSEEEIPLCELVAFLPIGAALSLFREYLL